MWERCLQLNTPLPSSNQVYRSFLAQEDRDRLFGGGVVEEEEEEEEDMKEREWGDQDYAALFHLSLLGRHNKGKGVKKVNWREVESSPYFTMNPFPRATLTSKYKDLIRWYKTRRIKHSRGEAMMNDIMSIHKDMMDNGEF